MNCLLAPAKAVLRQPGRTTYGIRQKTTNTARKTQKKINAASYQFIDRSRIRVVSGSGGNGSLSTQIVPRKRMIRPDGGNGGDGGSVILVADPNQQTLSRSQPHIAASKGEHGSGQNCHGARGRNRIIRVPAGVVVKRVLQLNEEWDEETKSVITLEDEQILTEEEIEEDEEDDRSAMINSYEAMVTEFKESGKAAKQYLYADEGGEEVKERQVVVLADLDEPGAHVVVARGGRGGHGTSIFARRHGPMPPDSVIKKRGQPRPGQVVYLELELKSIADIGLVGFPNAGKSSLLRAMSKATPEVAPYPFTTLHPLIGYINYRDGFRIAAADIPGLIDGASEGRGKGHDFLRHVERTKALMYVVDAGRVDFRDPIDDLNVLAKELASYGDGTLMERRALVAANKIDLLHEDQTAELLVKLSDASKELGIECKHDVMGISAGVTGEGLGVLSKAMRDVVIKSEEDRQEAFMRSQQLEASM